VPPVGHLHLKDPWDEVLRAVEEPPALPGRPPVNTRALALLRAVQGST